MKIKKTLVTVLASILGVAGLAVAPNAVAAERNLVAFGDSVFADPDAGIYLQDRWTRGSSGTPVGYDCPSSNNFAKRTGAKLGLPVRDFSCSGAVSLSPGPQIFSQVDQAINSGALSPATQRVVFTSGFNDTYNNMNLSMQQIRDRFVRTTKPQIDRIKRAAPNARIQIVGYPTIGSGNSYCLIHVGPQPLDRTHLPMVRDFENRAQWMQVDLAGATGTQFVDMKPHTRNNGMCAPANQRMWAGLIDFTAGDGNLPIHINARGHEHVANVLARS